jgi:hypothetical protein
MHLLYVDESGNPDGAEDKYFVHPHFPDAD